MLANTNASDTRYFVAGLMLTLTMDRMIFVLFGSEVIVLASSDYQRFGQPHRRSLHGRTRKSARAPTNANRSVTRISLVDPNRTRMSSGAPVERATRIA